MWHSPQDGQPDQPKEHAIARPGRSQGNIGAWFDALTVCLWHVGIRELSIHCCIPPGGQSFCGPQDASSTCLLLLLGLSALICWVIFPDFTVVDQNERRHGCSRLHEQQEAGLGL